MAVEPVGSAVQRQQAFAVTGTAHGEMALHLGRVEYMQVAGAVVGHEVGDVDQRVDRPQADRGQAPLQPWRRRTVLDAAHQPQRKARAKRLVLDGDLYRTRELALDRLDRRVLELAHVGGGKVAGDAVHAGAILPVRRQVDFQRGPL